MAKILGSLLNDIIYTHLEIEHNNDGTHQSTVLNFDVEHDTDGTHGAITPTSVTSTGVIVGTSISAPTGNAIKWKLFDGTTDADAMTTFSHGLTESNIICALCSIQSSVFTDGNDLGDMGSGGWAAADAYRWYSDEGTFVINNVGSRCQSRPYRVIIFYI